MQVQIGHRGGDDAELRAAGEHPPAARRREARAQTAGGAERGHPPRVEVHARRAWRRAGGGTAGGAEKQLLGEREHRREARRLVREGPAQRAQPAGVDGNRARNVVERGRTGRRLRDPDAPARDRIGDGVAIRIAQRVRIHQRDAHREGVALVGRELRRVHQVIEVEPAERERREREVEGDERSADVPRHAGRDVLPRQRPRRPRPQRAVLHAEAEVVAGRHVAREQHRPLGVADVHRVREGKERTREQIVGRLDERFRDARRALRVLRPQRSCQLVVRFAQHVLQLRRRADADRRPR